MKKNIIFYIVLTIILFCGYFLFLGSYPLLDVDETRYVEMARSMFNSHDYMTLYLNQDYFFEKPPMFFWIECIGFKIFGGVNEFSARLPIVLLSLLPLGLIFGLCKKIKNTVFAFIVSAVLLTSLEYILLTKIAILDSVLTSFVSSAILCYFYTFFVKENSKKYFWMLSYIFTGFALLAKGIPGFVIPLMTIAVSTFVFKTYKETFKYAFSGMLIIFAIALPWHVVMLKTYPELFFDEYIYKHHILRFLGSDVINKNQPWYFYFLTLIWGLFPHIFIVLSKLFEFFKKSFLVKNFKFNINIADNYKKFLILNTIVCGCILLFFSVSGAKLVTYILPIYPFTAVLIANLWMNYIKKDDIVIKNSILALNWIFIIAVIITPFLTAIMPFEIGGMFYHIQMLAMIIILPFAWSILNQIFSNKRLKVFILQTLFFTFLIGVMTPPAYNLDYNFGQADLIKFAKFAKENNYNISTYKIGKKYSLLYYSNLPFVEFQTEDDLDWLGRKLKEKNTLLVMKNKDIEKFSLSVKMKGRKYSIIEEKLNEK